MPTVKKLSQGHAPSTCVFVGFPGEVYAPRPRCMCTSTLGSRKHRRYRYASAPEAPLIHHVSVFTSAFELCDQKPKHLRLSLSSPNSDINPAQVRLFDPLFGRSICAHPTQHEFTMHDSPPRGAVRMPQMCDQHCFACADASSAKHGARITHLVSSQDP